MRTRSFAAGALASLMCLLVVHTTPAFGAFHLEYVEGAERADFVGQPSSVTPQAPKVQAAGIDGNGSSGTGEPEVSESGSTAPRAAYSQGWGSVQERIAAAWPGDDRKALAVVHCETGGTYDPSIKNPSGKYKGLFQADSDFSSAYAGVSDATSLSVEEQTAMAWRGYVARGWAPWECA